MRRRHISGGDWNTPEYVLEETTDATDHQSRNHPFHAGPACTLLLPGAAGMGSAYRWMYDVGLPDDAES